jgi:hypothetical protein
MKTRDEESLNKEKSRSGAELTLRKQHAARTTSGRHVGGAKDDLAEIRPFEQTTTLPFFAASSFHTTRLAEGKRIRPLALEQLHS